MPDSYDIDVESNLFESVNLSQYTLALLNPKYAGIKNNMFIF